MPEMIPIPLFAGFSRGPVNEAENRIVPSCVRVAAPQGRYALRVRLAAEKDTADALLFGTHRRLLWRGSLKAGQSADVDALIAVHPYLPESVSDPMMGDAVELALIAPGARIADVQLTPCDAPAIFLMGDSTVTDQGAVSPYAPGATYCGWGQMLPLFLGSSACVLNFARSGLTVETFRTEGLYEIMRPLIRPGDHVLMQFGHNDQKRPHLTAQGGYARALFDYLSDIRSLGASPVLVTPLARNSWWDDERYNDMLAPFALAAKRMGEAVSVPVVDLHAFMRGTLEAMRRDPAKVLFHPGDYTHTNDFGAHRAARFVAGELDRLGVVPIVDTGEWLPVPPFDDLPAPRIDEGQPPQGLDAVYAAYETVRPDAPLTRIEALELACRACGLFAHNERVSLPEDVPLSEDYTATVRCALQHGLIPAHFLTDGKLRRHRAVTLAEFADVLSRGCRMRLPGMDIGAIAPDQAAGPVTRTQAAAICRRIHI